MKSLKEFRRNQLDNKTLKVINGGTGREVTEFLDYGPLTHDTGAFIDDNFTYEDTWTDNDGNYELTPGDVICYN